MLIKPNRGVVFASALFLLMTFIECTIAQDNDRLTSNEKAIEVFKSHLALADTVSSLELLAKTKSIWVSDIEETLKFLEQVTQIPSTTEYTHAGRFYIPREDYKKWKTWLDEYKDKLIWNREKQRVEVKEN